MDAIELACPQFFRKQSYVKLSCFKYDPSRSTFVDREKASCRSLRWKDGLSNFSLLYDLLQNPLSVAAMPQHPVPGRLPAAAPFQSQDAVLTEKMLSIII